MRAMIVCMMILVVGLFLSSKVFADDPGHFLGAAINLGGMAGSGGGDSGVSRIAYLEYEKSWIHRLAFVVRLGGQSSYYRSTPLKYDWDAVGIDGEIRVYPFKGKMKGFHAGGSFGVWIVDWERKKYVGTTTNGNWVSDGSGTSPGYHFNGRVGHKFVFASNYYIDPFFQLGVFTISDERSSVYLGLGAGAGLIW